MYTNSAFFNNSQISFKDNSKPLIVSSCGTYRLSNITQLPTLRPKGRPDYQLLYVAAGKAHFYFDSKEEIVSAGHMVLYYPKEPQKYVYYGTDKTEVYWVHFTGGKVKEILSNYHIPSDKHVIFSGTSAEYQWLFRQMIQELQMCRPGYEELLTLMLRQIFLLIDRQLQEKKGNSYIQEEIEKATYYFNENYHKDISIEEYAASRHVSTCWFIRSFKHYTGMTPMQYILSIRIANAQNLLETTGYTISEIAAIVGYDNPLYFSRIFKKQKGLSPKEYRTTSSLQLPH